METENYLGQVKNTEVYTQDGYAIEKRVEAVVNSANNGLLLGTSGAGKIRDLTGLIQDGSPEMDEFKSISEEVGRFGRFCKAWLDYDSKQNKEKGNPTIVGPTYVQLECLRKIKENGGKAFDLGTAILTSSGNYAKDASKPKYIIHAIGMGYIWPEYHTDPITGEKNPRPEIKATRETVKSALEQTLKLVDQYKIESLALPIMCARIEEREGKLKVYGLTPQQSYNLTLETLKENPINCLKKVIICADNSSTKAYIKELEKQDQEIEEDFKPCGCRIWEY